MRELRRKKERKKEEEEEEEKYAVIQKRISPILCVYLTKYRCFWGVCSLWISFLLLDFTFELVL